MGVNGGARQTSHHDRATVAEQAAEIAQMREQVQTVRQELLSTSKADPSMGFSAALHTRSGTDQVSKTFSAKQLCLGRFACFLRPL